MANQEGIATRKLRFTRDGETFKNVVVDNLPGCGFLEETKDVSGRTRADGAVEYTQGEMRE